MATKSVYKNVRITKHMCKNLVFALEHAYQKQPTPVKMQRVVSEVRGEEIKKLFTDPCKKNAD